jgi:hypothetical protein
MFSDPGMLSGFAEKLAAQANPDVISSALDQMSQTGLGQNPLDMQNPMGMSDIMQQNPLLQRQPGVPASPGQQVDLGNSSQFMPQQPQPGQPPRPNLDPRSAALLSQMAAGRGAERPPMAPAVAPRGGQAVNADFTSLLFGGQSGVAKPNPRTPALAHLLGLVR